MEIDFFLGPTRESESVDDVHIDASEVTISMPKLHVVPVYNLNLVDSKKDSAEEALIIAFRHGFILSAPGHFELELENGTD